MTETSEEEKTKSKGDQFFYNLALPNKLFLKIEKIINMRRFFEGPGLNKTKFVLEAIEEKMKSDANDPMASAITEKKIYLKYNMDLEKRLRKQVDWIKKYRKNYSKKQWIEEAVFEKIDREENAWQSKLQEEREKEVMEGKN